MRILERMLINFADKNYKKLSCFVVGQRSILQALTKIGKQTTIGNQSQFWIFAE